MMDFSPTRRGKDTHLKRSYLVVQDGLCVEKKNGEQKERHYYGIS
jgi:hypothetical protein